MAFQKSILALSVAASVALLGGCSSSDSDNDSDPVDDTSATSGTVTLTNDNIYSLASGFPGTKIGNGDDDTEASEHHNMELVIEEGTLILGRSKEALVITRGSTIDVQGTAENPVVMTSRDQFDNWRLNDDATSGRGEWAGIALMGYAKSNECPDTGTCHVEAEGDIGSYGGEDDADNSGSISYMVVRHAGNDIDGNGNELNGFTLFSVGSETSIDHIQVHKGLDDGVEHFGSTDHMSHVVLTANRDDSFDWGQGYTGSAQFVVVKQAEDDADRAIEADNDKNDNNALPISQPMLANMTLVGVPNDGNDDNDVDNGDASADGILLRRGTGANIYNTVVTGFADACLDLDDDGTFERAYTNGAYTDDLTFDNSFVDCATNFEGDDTGLNGKTDADIFAESGDNNSSTTTVELSDSLVPTGDFATAATDASMALNLGGKFVEANYAGAFDPAATTQWTEGWTVDIHGNTHVWAPVGDTPVADGSCPELTTFVETIELPADVGGGSMDVCQLQRQYDGSDF